MIYLVFAIVFITCLCILLCLAEFDRIKDFVGFTKLFISNIVTFISISFAFYLTNLTILFSSKYIKDFRQEDNIKPNQRKIHTLKGIFHISNLLCITHNHCKFCRFIYSGIWWKIFTHLCILNFNGNFYRKFYFYFFAT